jgi:polyribonucleotide nucleotidyltransferase
MAFSAADLQKKHELEGAPDPFPSLAPAPIPKARASSVHEVLDTEDQTAFPTLAPLAPSNNASSKSSAWGAGNGPRIAPVLPKTPVFSDSFTLSAIDLSTSGKDGKPASLGEVLKQVITKYKIKIEASANQKTRQTTFHLKAENQKDLDKAKRSLLALLSPTITLVINAPASTIGSIIGPKGATLKQIRDQTSVRVDIPRRDTLEVPGGVTRTNSAQSSGKTSPVPVPDDEEEESTIPVTLTGPQPLAYEAQALLNQIISSKTSRATQRVRDIPVHVLPFIAARHAIFRAAAESDDITLQLNTVSREVTVSGDRSAVVRVIETVKANLELFKSSLTPVKISIPKRQHRLLQGKAVDEILTKSKCTVLIPAADDASEEVTVWGMGTDLGTGLSAVMEKANSQYIHEYFIPGPINRSRQILTYLARTGYPKTISSSNPGVTVYLPSASAANKATAIAIDLVGEKSVVDAAIKQTSDLLGKLIGATSEVSVDWLIHRIITGKNAKKLKQLQEAHNVLVYFPPESEEQSLVVLVYDPLSPAVSPADKEKHLDDVSKEILKLAKDAADVKSVTLTIDKKWHDSVTGWGGTTLNAIIGEDTTLSIKLGLEAGADDAILIRGASSEVDRAVKEIHQIVESAKNDEIVNSFSTEFEIDREFVGRIVGSQGSGVNKLRDQLGVKVDVSDDVDGEKEVGKRKKVVHQKSKVKITGRKENVEEAKKRILTQIERLADETSEVLKIPSQYHSSLIGQSGKYAIRLEEKYGVKITFPRQSAENGEGRTREQLKSDEVLIKGGKKGVAGAKSELLDATEFEKESNNTLKFTVPSRAVARILGKGGASINEIKDNTGAQIDVDKNDDSGSVTHITVRGTKKAVAEAKTAILAISDQVGEEVTVSVTIESKFHRTLIGGGGQGLKDLVTRCGGPSDPKVQAGLIHFPRQGEPSDEVRLRGEPKLVEKLRVELEKIVATLRDRIVLAVEVPAAQHRALIGRGGQNLNDIQNRNGVQVQFPGSRSYQQVGEPENTAELSEVDPTNLVKISGPRAACEKAIEELKGQIKPPAPEEITATVSVPLKYHHVISQQGSFFRNLRNYGVQVDQSVQPQKSAVPPRPSSIPQPEAASARIDEADEEPAPTVDAQWQVALNYQDAEEGDSEWTLRARDQAALDRAQKAIREAIQHAENMTHVGFLTLADRSVFPRIVGSKGANVARLRAETGADITVGRDDNTIVIIGNESSILTAKEAIIRTATNPGRPQRRYED